MTKPALRPERPHFSSGPCAKRPGWTPEILSSAVLGRSHRSAAGKAKLAEVIQLSRDVLGIPADYRLGIVPASDTGAVEMALWSLLGPRRVTVLAWESFSSEWAGDVAQELKLTPHVLRANYGELPDLEHRRLVARRGVRVERHHVRRVRSRWRLDPGRPRRPRDLRCHLRRVRDGSAVGQARCRDLVLAEGAGRRSGARHDRALAARGGAPDHASSPPGRSPRSSAWPRTAS